MKKGFLFIFSFLFVLFSLLIGSDSNTPKGEYPILTTSAGQSSDINTVNIILEEAGIKFDYCDVPDLDLVKSGVGLGDKQSDEGFHVEMHTDLSKYKKGTAYKTVVFAIGASLKGMGASGLTIADEIKRVNSIIQYCKKNKVFIIALHVGGVSKRGAASGDNERMIDAVAPFADYLIVVQDSNKDGRFTKISQKNKKPFTEVENALAIVEIFQKTFGS